MTTTLLTALILDLITVLIFALSVTYGAHKGLIHTLYRLLYWLIALFLTNLLYPYMVQLLSLSPLEDIVSAAVSSVFSVSDIVSEAASSTSETIGSLGLPDTLTSKLIENNNYEVYALLGVDTLDEYITAYLTNMIMNAAAQLITFAFVIIIMHIISVLLNIVNILPVIGRLNRLLGGFAGIFCGLLYVWIFCLILTVLGSLEPMSVVYPGLNQSILTGFFYQNNILLDALLSITG